MSSKSATQHIEITPGVCGGKPRIAGHRIRVQDIVIWHEMMGLSADEIIYHHPSIGLAEVYAALSYYYDNLPEIRQNIRESEAFAKELAATTPSILQRKLKEKMPDRIRFHLDENVSNAIAFL